MGYERPRKRLHRDFVYLNHETVLNSLSAIEAGKVDEIIQKMSEATDKGLEGGVSLGPAKAGASKKKQAQMEYELVRTRTRFSAFEAWYQQLRQEKAIGRFDNWSTEVRDEMEVGDTVEFRASISLSPFYLMIASYQSFVDMVNRPGSVFKLQGQELKEAKSIAQMMNLWISRPDGTRSILSYFAPFGVDKPRVIGALDESYLVGGLQNIQGDFSVVAQIDALLEPGERYSVMRVLSDVPPTPVEIQAVDEALTTFQGEAADGLGVEFTDDDRVLSHPAVVVRPLAIYK